MALTTSPNCGGTLSWIPYNLISSFSLPAVSGNQNIYAKFKSISGITTSCVVAGIDYYPSAPSVAAQSGPQIIAVGSALSLSASVTGTQPITYEWRQNGITIAGQNTSSIYINPAQSSNAGSYVLIATNLFGSATSAPMSVSFIGTPSISVQPVSLTVAPGGNASFSVTAAGSGTLSYQWMKNGVDIPGATLTTYSISSAQALSAGAYMVRITSAYGTVTSRSADLTVNAPPVVLSQPQALTVVQGSSASLAVNAIGPNLTYQWTKNAIDIAGASALAAPGLAASLMAAFGLWHLA